MDHYNALTLNQTQEGPTLDNYEEQKEQLTEKTKIYETKLKTLMEQLAEEKGSAPEAEDLPQTSTLDEVWYVT